MSVRGDGGSDDDRVGNVVNMDEDMEIEMELRLCMDGYGIRLD